MLVEFGHFTLLLALIVSLVQTTVPLYGAYKGYGPWMAIARPAAVLQLILLSVSFSILMYAFVVSDFSVALVVKNSHTLKPMLYKITGVWGNHEGSMLLWCLILALFGALVALFGRHLPTTFIARVLGVQGSIGVAFLSFLIFTSNPFLRLQFPPFDGTGLNPMLQDPGLAFHPPFLYFGYVGLSTTFSFAVAALLEGRVNAAWGRWVRPWTLLAWLNLTVGIALGSWWAYYELGWGGFWFWDPVENASFMPWLISAALLHSAIVVEKREVLKVWTILLAILAFGFSLIGTFIVRSGVLTSVHAFANDPERGVYLLGIAGFFIGGALILFSIRAGTLKANGAFAFVSRESALILNNVLLAVSAFVVFIGTIWPLIAEMAFGRTLSVGPPFFDASFTPFMIGLAVILPIGSILPWKRAKLGRTAILAWPAFLLAALLAMFVWSIGSDRSLLAPIGTALGSWLIFGSLADLISRTGRGSAAARLRRLTRLPRADFGKAVSHAGFGVTTLGVALLLAWQVEVIRVANIGETFKLGDYDVTMESVQRIDGPNYVGEGANMRVERDGELVANLFPEKRFYPVAGTPTTEAAIRNGVFADIYVVLGDKQDAGGWAVRAHIKPFANWIWVGAILMAFGGVLSLSDRRVRITAGARKSTQAVAAQT